MATGRLAMPVEDRRHRLLEMVRSRRFASLPELAEALEVSESTVRRDLDLLEEQGAARRTHGGVLYVGEAPQLPHFESRQSSRWPQKRAIAEAAVSLVEEGDTVLLDGGSTTYEVARLLVGRSLHVITTSLPVANLFACDTQSDLVMVGGNICPRTGVAQGPVAAGMIGALKVRKTILSVAAVHDEGYFNNNLLLVETERAMMAAADEVIVVADSSKLGRQSLAYLCSLARPQYFVVDDGIAPVWRDKITAAGVKLVVAAIPQDKETVRSLS